jgi:molybdenum cofactor cytidylyltransferase
MTSHDIAAIVLAAGRGTRFGPEPKLLAEFEGKPLVRHAVEAALASSAGAVIVVVGDHEAEVRAALEGLPVVFMPNPGYAAGLSTSLKAGLAEAPEASEAVVVLLGDMPLVSSGLIDGLIAAWREAGKPDAVVPVREGRRGNPVLLATRLAPEIAELEGDTGAAPLLRGRANVLEWNTDDPTVAADVDTPEALAEIAKPAQA